MSSSRLAPNGAIFRLILSNICKWDRGRWGRGGEGERGRGGEKDYNIVFSFVAAPLPFQEYELNHAIAQINAVEGDRQKYRTYAYRQTSRMLGGIFNVTSLVEAPIDSLPSQEIQLTAHRSFKDR